MVVKFKKIQRNGSEMMTGYRKLLGAFLFVGCIICVGGIYGYAQKDSELVLDQGIAEAEMETTEITVYVCGAVNHPGVVQVKEGARIVDAVQACGGVLPTADTRAINMAKVVKDGEQIRVPEQTAVALENLEGNSHKADGRQAKNALVNLNTASAEELDQLPGVGPSTANAIVEYRTQEGAFTSIEDVKKVKGIGEAKFQKMSSRICI